MTDNVAVLPEKIRLNLAKCQNHQQMTCLECGYSGLMGVYREVRHWRKPIVVVAVIYFSLALYASFLSGANEALDVVATLVFLLFPSWVNYLVGAFIFLTISTKTQMFLCPNCERELVKR